METFKLLDSKNLSATDLDVIKMISKKPYISRNNLAIIQFKVTNNDIDIDNCKISNEALVELKHKLMGKQGLVQGCRLQPAIIFRTSVSTNGTLKTKDGKALKTLYAKAFIMLSSPDAEALVVGMKQSRKHNISIAYSVNKIVNKQLFTPEPVQCQVYYNIAECFEWKLILEP